MMSLSRSSNPDPRASGPYYKTKAEQTYTKCVIPLIILSLSWQRWQKQTNKQTTMLPIHIEAKTRKRKPQVMILTGTLRDLGGPGGPGMPGGPGRPTPGSPCREETVIVEMPSICQLLKATKHCTFSPLAPASPAKPGNPAGPL